MSKTLGTVAARRQTQRDAGAPTGRKRYASDDKGNRWMVTLNLGHTTLEHLSTEKKIMMRRFNAAAQVPPCTYAVFQVEVGESGNLHLQGYFEFNKRMTLNQVHNHCGGHAHCELAKGNQQQCIDYCTKEDTRMPDTEPKSYGEPMKLNRNGGTSGSRTDWADIVRMVKEGEHDAEIISAHPAATPHTKAIGAARFAFQSRRSRSEQTELLVFYGEPGTGKTRTAIGLCDPGTYFIINADGKQLWWDGYDPDKHTTIIFDEFTGSRCPLTFLNQLADRYDIDVQTKGSFKRFLAKRIIITSNFAPYEWYKGVAQSKFEALERRIKVSVHFNWVQQIIDMSKPEITKKKLHLTVNKGSFNFNCVETEEGLDHCCEALRTNTEPEPQDEDDSEEEVQQMIRNELQQDGQSPSDEMDVEDSLDSDEVVWTRKQPLDSVSEEEIWEAPKARRLNESGFVSRKGKNRRLEDSE